MYCKKCGRELEDGSKFCHVCGARQSASHSKNTARDVAPGNRAANSCPNCGGLLKYREDSGSMDCPYCGYSGRSNETDAVRLEKLRLEARMKEAEAKRLAQQHEQDLSEAARERERLTADRNRRYHFYRHSKMRGWCIFFTVISALFFIGAVRRDSPLFLILNSLQLLCFILYFMVGSQFIPEKKDHLHRVFGIIGMVLVIPILMQL